MATAIDTVTARMIANKDHLPVQRNGIGTSRQHIGGGLWLCGPRASHMTVT